MRNTILAGGTCRFVWKKEEVDSPIGAQKSRRLDKIEYKGTVE